MILSKGLLCLSSSLLLSKEPHRVTGGDSVRETTLWQEGTLTTELRHTLMSYVTPLSYAKNRSSRKEYLSRDVEKRSHTTKLHG